MQSTSVLYIVLVYLIGTVVTTGLSRKNVSAGAVPMMYAMLLAGVTLFFVYVFGTGRMIGATNVNSNPEYWVMPGVYWAVTIYAGVVTISLGLIRSRNIVLVAWTILSLVITTFGLGILGFLTFTK